MIAVINKNWSEVIGGEPGQSDNEALEKALESNMFQKYRELLPTSSNFRLSHKLVFSEKPTERGFGEDINPDFLNRDAVKMASAKYIQEKEQRERIKKRRRRQQDH